MAVVVVVLTVVEAVVRIVFEVRKPQNYHSHWDTENKTTFGAGVLGSLRRRGAKFVARNRSSSWGRPRTVLKRLARGPRPSSGRPETVSGPSWGILGAPGTVLGHHGARPSHPSGYVKGGLGAIMGVALGRHWAVSARLGRALKPCSGVFGRRGAIVASDRLGSACVIAKNRRDDA